MEHHALSALLKRSGPEARHRMLLLFHCFRSVELSTPATSVTAQDAQSEDDDSGTNYGTRLSLDNVVYLTHQLIAFDRLPPKFVFATGPKGNLLRSADRGRTWRRFIVKQSVGTESPSGEAPTSEVPASLPGDGDDDRGREINDILSLLPGQEGGSPRDDGDEEDTGSDDSEEVDSDAEDLDERGETSGVATPSAPAPPGKKPLATSATNGGKVSAVTKARQARKTTVIAPKSTDPPDLLCVACYEDSVAVCGSNGTVAVSVDRGVTLHTLDPSKMALLRDRTRTKCEYLQLRGICFLSSQVILFHSYNSVFRLSYDATSLNEIRFGDVELLVKFTRGPIGVLEALDRFAFDDVATLNSARRRDVYVSTPGCLHVSVDDGNSFVPIAHSVGLIRCLVPVESDVEPSHRPKHPCLNEALAAVGESPPTAGVPMEPQAPPSSVFSAESAQAPVPQTSAGNSKKFSYSIESKLQRSEISVAAASQKKSKSAAEVASDWPCAFVASLGPILSTTSSTTPNSLAAPPKSKSVRSQSAYRARYRSFFVLCTEGKIVPYDFTAVLHIVAGQGQQDTINPTASVAKDHQQTTMLLHTTASNVDYIVFVQSSIDDKAGLSLSKRCTAVAESDADGNGGIHNKYSLLRSTISGVSVSYNFGSTWSSPLRSYAGISVPLDEGCVVVGSQRKSVFVTEDFGKSFATYVLPTELRVPTISHIAVMR